MDCCRGNQQINEISTIISSKSRKTSTYISKLSDIYVHYSTSNNYQSYIKDISSESYLIAALYKCNKQKLITLHDISIIIN